jgi:EmrB/QacA subfamily drug resistance transporter
MTTTPLPRATTSADPAAQPAARRGLAGLCLSMLLSTLGTSIANVALPTLAADFDASFSAVQWVVLAYLLAVTSTLVAAGRLGDRFGRRRLLAGGIVLFTTATALAAGAPSVAVLVAARALQGLGGAAMIAHTVALVANTVPPGRTGSAMGLLGAMSAVGTALGPSLGGSLIAACGWRSIFLVQVPFGLLALWLVARGLPAEPPPRRTTRAGSDPFGTLLLAGALIAYALAATDRGGPLGPRALLLHAVAALTALAFVQVERRVAAPLLRLSLFRDADLTAGLLRNLVVSTVVMATLVVGPFHLSRGLGLDAAGVGAVLSVGPLVAALAGIPAGRLVDRLGAAATGALGLAAMAGGATLLVLLPATLGVPGYAAPIVVLTAGYAGFQAANNTAVMAATPPEQRGVVSGVLNLSRNLGLVTGVAVLGAVFTAAAGGDVATAAPGAVARGMRVTFAVAAVLLGLALAGAITRRRAPRRQRPANPPVAPA